MKDKFEIRSILVWGLVAVTSLSATAGEPLYELVRSSFDGGGGVRSTGGDFELSGTIGQPDAGSMAGGGFEVFGGYWFPLAPTDCNDDGSVNLLDHATFDACLTGPDGAVSIDCRCLDVNHSGTVDLADFAEAQLFFTGP